MRHRNDRNLGWRSGPFSEQSDSARGDRPPERASLVNLIRQIATTEQGGFRLVWGVEVTPSNADECEATLRGWTDRWRDLAGEVGVTWNGEPYQPGDFQNALCIFQERGNPGYRG